jgi:peptide/nickel transport system permease protein
MGRFLAGRLLQAGSVVLVATALTFVLLHAAPGEPLLGSLENPSVRPEVREMQRRAFGLDRPVGEQLILFVRNVARGDLGWSFSHNRPVRAVLATAIPRTLLLMSVALVASFAAGIALGVLQGMRRRTPVDRLLTATSLMFYSMPDFWLALAMAAAFAHWLPLFPTSGMCDPVMCAYLTPWRRALDVGRHLVLPAATLTLLTAAGIARFQRAAVLDAVHQDYVRTARAKGLPERRVVTRHVLRNALVPVITMIGLAIPVLLGGAVFVEFVFAWPGMGLVVVNGIMTRDYALVTSAVIIGSALVSIGSLVADILHAALDPRVRTP